MTKIAKTLTAALILVSVSAASSASAQNVQMPSMPMPPAQSWDLRDVLAQDQALPINSYREQISQTGQFTPWPDHNSEQFTKVDLNRYSKFDSTEFNSEFTGPVNLSVRPEYQELFTPQNTYLESYSSRLDKDLSDTAVTAAARVKLKF